MLQPRTLVTAAFFSLSLCVCDISAQTTPLPGSVEGKVVDAATGAPIADCRVLARRTSSGSIFDDQAAPCNSDGTFKIELAPGEYRVWISPSLVYTPYMIGVGNCNLRATYNPVCDTTRGDPLRIEFSGQVLGPFEARLEKGASIAGTIVLPGGNDAPATESMRVSLYDERNEEIESIIYGLPEYSQLHYFDFGSKASGSYRVVFEGGSRWKSEVYGGEACSRWSCDPSSGAPIILAAGQHFGSVHFLPAPLQPYTGCTDTAGALCLQEGRFRVKARWKDFLGQTGLATPVRITDESAYFWFFDPGNVELMVKALNACTPRLGNNFWVFAAGLTNVEVELEVEDTLAGTTRLYENPLGRVQPPVLDVNAFDTCGRLENDAAFAVPAEYTSLALAPAPAAAPDETAMEAAGGPCVADPANQILCLAGGRFRVFVDFQTTPLAAVGRALVKRLTDNSAAYSFFSSRNIEILVKVLDGCSQPLAGYWVFAAGMTDVGVAITVEDTATGETKVYRNAFVPFKPIFDLESFASSCG
jgi:hypothetical protein